MIAGTSFKGCNNNTCFAELWPQINGTYIQTKKMNTPQSERPLNNSSIMELLQSYKPPNGIRRLFWRRCL